MTVRTRIAPSPTGYMHIGTLRTILWDIFLAKQNEGTFVIRIEDTDQERFVPGSVEALLKTLTRAGISWDEGPILNADGTLGSKGDYGPYIQTERLEHYRKYADQLLAQGDAYHCFCTPERLTEMREAQQALKQTPKYDRHCLSLTLGEITAKLAELKPGDSHVIRLKVPDGVSEFTDAIRGAIRFNNADVDDQVLMKSNGIPTYHLAVVVDDELMKITHVLRGEEWLSSTPKQIMLCRMLGFTMPVYAHVPLLLNADKTKLSKRKGDVFVETFLDKGYLPVALKNYLATLGFNPTGDREIYTMDELTQAFNLSKVNRAGAVVNMEKLDWMNNHYMREMDKEALFNELRPFLPQGVEESEVVKRAMVVERERAQTLVELASRFTSYIEAPSFAGIEEKLVFSKSTKENTREVLTKLLAVLEDVPPTVFDGVHNAELFIKTWITDNGYSNGEVLWPLRFGLSGLEKSASPFDYLWALGQSESLKRIRTALAALA